MRTVTTESGVTYPAPAPGDILDALRDHGLAPTLWGGWDTRGRPWNAGLRALVDHYTAGVGPGVREWCANDAGRYPFVNAFVDRSGGYTLLSALSCWGSGTGGPWAGVAAADSLHLVAYQTEVESWGTSNDFTDEMLEALGRGNAAIVDLGVPAAHEVNHRDWTDGTGGVGGYPLSTAGRKPDTGYPTETLRANTARYLRPAPPAPAPSEEDDMAIVIHGRTRYLLSGGRLARIGQVTRDKAVAAGVPEFGVDAADWPALLEAYGSMSMRADG